MVRSIRRCLGAVIMLGPLMAMLAMINYGVPQMAPRVELPEWLGGDGVTALRTDVATTAGKDTTALRSADDDETLPSMRPLSATSRRTRSGKPRVVSRPSEISWKHLRVALSAHGIEQFQIQPGSRAGEVHFSCVQPVPGRNRVVRRFEAEAADPIRAARDVLKQIEQLNGGLNQVVRVR
uniref:Uncharacterized protein n=1 Tax=uncultured Planctomycetota bacterium TaxID=120965 RepID=A0A1B0Z225_9BACT|nr:hypothetical protein [uncultured Planctomycetota bacterium]